MICHVPLAAVLPVTPRIVTPGLENGTLLVAKPCADCVVITIGVVLLAAMIVLESVPTLVSGKTQLVGITTSASVPAATEFPVMDTTIGLLSALEVNVSV